MDDFWRLSYLPMDYDPEPGDVVADDPSRSPHVTAATRRPSTLEQYVSYSATQLSDTEATSVSAYDSDASVDDEEESYAIEDVMARGAPRAYAGASGGAHKAYRSDFGPSETDDSSDYGQNMLASETTGAGDDNMKPAHRRRFQWGPARCCVSYRIGALTVVADYHDALGRSTKLMLGPYWPYMVVTAVTVSVITALVYHVVVPASYPLLRLAGVALAALSIVFLLCTALADPGVFKRHPQPLGPDWTYAEVRARRDGGAHPFSSARVG